MSCARFQVLKFKRLFEKTSAATLVVFLETDLKNQKIVTWLHGIKNKISILKFLTNPFQFRFK